MHQYPPQPKQEFWQPYMMQPQQPPKRNKRNTGKFLLIGCGVLVLLIIIGAVIARVVGSRPSSSTTAGQRLAVVTPAGIQLGPQPCPSAAQSGGYWEMIMGTSATQKVEGVLCGYLIGVPSLQAVVKVRYGGADGLLDIDVYTNITSSHPTRIFL